MVDMNFLMKQAKKMQEQLQQKLAQMEVIASAGGGAVTVTVNGHKEAVAVKIEDDSVLADREMLEDLVLAALGEAYRKVDEEMARTMKGLPGGGMLPGMF